jgi:hypothetical protein
MEHMQHDWPNHRIFCRPYIADAPNPSDVEPQQPVAYSSYPNSYAYPPAATPLSVPSSPPTSNRFSSNPGASMVASQGSMPDTAVTPSNGISASASSTSQASTAPTASFDGLLFAHNEDRPRIVRVQCMAQTQPTGPTIWTPIPQEHIGNIEGGISNTIITNGIGGAALRFPLHLFYGSQSFADGSPVNRVIYRMTGGKSTFQWAG